MRKIKFEIQLSGAPYPAECWWRIRGSNGRIIVASELMSKKHALKITAKVVSAIQAGRFSVVELNPHEKKGRFIKI